MEYPNIADGNSVVHEMQVDLRWCWRGLVERYTALALSQETSVLLASGLWSSAKSCRSQDASATPLATARSSASALEREATGCRLDDQETRLPPRKTA